MATFRDQIVRLSQRVLKDLLPDVCTITTVGGAPTITPDGVYTPGGPVSRTYTPAGGSPTALIPCRFDTSRSFRPERLPVEEINANEYILHLPRGFVVLPNDKITRTKDGVDHIFEVRKLTHLSEWSLTTEALVVELQGQY